MLGMSVVAAQAFVVVVSVNERLTNLKKEAFYHHLLKTGVNFQPCVLRSTVCMDHALCYSEEGFCVYCRFPRRRNQFSFAKKPDEAFFTVKGFENIKNAVEKLQVHVKSASHLEAKMNWGCLNNPSIKEQISTEAAQVVGAIPGFCQWGCSKQ